MRASYEQTGERLADGFGKQHELGASVVNLLISCSCVMYQTDPTPSLGDGGHAPVYVKQQKASWRGTRLIRCLSMSQVLHVFLLSEVSGGLAAVPFGKGTTGTIDRVSGARRSADAKSMFAAPLSPFSRLLESACRTLELYTLLR